MVTFLLKDDIIYMNKILLFKLNVQVSHSHAYHGWTYIIIGKKATRLRINN